MNYKIMMVMLVLCLLLASLSAVAGADDGRTFSAVGKSVGYSADILHHSRLTKDANIELMEFKVQNHNNPVKYNVTLSQEEFNQLKAAKDNGEFKEIQVETNQSISVKQPVIENYTRKVCSQDYFDDASFERDLSNLDQKLFDNSIDVNVTDHVSPVTGAEYKKITIYKTDHVVKSFRNSSDYITASVVANDMQADGKDWVFFHAPSLGIDGTVAAEHIQL